MRTNRNFSLRLIKSAEAKTLTAASLGARFCSESSGSLTDSNRNRNNLNDEVGRFVSIYKPELQYLPHIANYLKSYITDPKFREIIDSSEYARLYSYPGFTIEEFSALGEWEPTVRQYVKDYVPLDQYMK